VFSCGKCISDIRYTIICSVLINYRINYFYILVRLMYNYFYTKIAITKILSKCIVINNNSILQKSLERWLRSRCVASSQDNEDVMTLPICAKKN